MKSCTYLPSSATLTKRVHSDFVGVLRFVLVCGVGTRCRPSIRLISTLVRPAVGPLVRSNRYSPSVTLSLAAGRSSHRRAERDRGVELSRRRRSVRYREPASGKHRFDGSLPTTAPSKDKTWRQGFVDCPQRLPSWWPCPKRSEQTLAIIPILGCKRHNSNFPVITGTIRPACHAPLPTPRLYSIILVIIVFIARKSRSYCTCPKSKRKLPYKVADMSLADWGRKEIELAEKRDAGADGPAARSTAQQAAHGRPHRRLPAHDHPDGRAHRDARRAWRRGHLDSCNIFSTQDHAAAAIAATGVPVYAWKGESDAGLRLVHRADV